MAVDIDALKLRLDALKKCVENNSKRISELEKKELVIEYKGLKYADECAKSEIAVIKNQIDMQTMKNCQHLYVMGKNPDIEFDDNGEFDMPFCIKCGLDGFYTYVERVETSKHLNIYNICSTSANLPYGVPEGTFLRDDNGELIKCDREEAYSIYQEIVQGATDIHNDTIEVLFIEEFERRREEAKKSGVQKNKKNDHKCG